MGEGRERWIFFTFPNILEGISFWTERSTQRSGRDSKFLSVQVLTPEMERRRTRTNRAHYCMVVTVFRHRPIFVTGCDLELLWHIVRQIRMEIILTGSRVPQSDPFISDLSQPTITISTPLLHPHSTFPSASHMAETQESIWNLTWISLQNGGLLRNNRHVPEATKCWTCTTSQDVYQTFINLFLLFYNELLCCKAKQ
jgi:hypothetical protein